MSGPKIAALYGLIPNKLGFCGPRQDLLKKFIAGKILIPEIIPTLEKFEAAYAYYELIAKKNKIKTGAFNKKVVEAYWLGNELLEKITADDVRELIVEKFTRPGLLSKKDAEKKTKQIPENSKPHHSFHVLVLGSITGRVDFSDNIKLKDICRIGWGRVLKIRQTDANRGKILVSYRPLIGKKVIEFGKPIKKEVVWDKEILPTVSVGEWVSFHWDYAIQPLQEENIVNLHYYTQNTINSLNEKK
jgi:hypothetical protein